MASLIKKGSAGSAAEAISELNSVWDDFTAETLSENLMNLLTYYSFRLQETEVPVLGLSLPVAGLNPAGLLTQAITWWMPYLNVRKEYFDLEELLGDACPKFADIKWSTVKTRLLIGASEIVHGMETVFDSAMNKGTQAEGIQGLAPAIAAEPERRCGIRDAARLRPSRVHRWRLLLGRSLLAKSSRARIPFECPEGGDPDEVWIVRINPQQWPECPDTRADILDRENELVGNLSLNKELDFIRMVNDMISRYGGHASRRVQAGDRAHHQDEGGDCKRPSIFVEV